MSGSIMILMAGGARVSSELFTNIEHNVFDPSDASAGINMQSDGTSGKNVSNTGTVTNWWTGAPLVGIGSSYWVRHTTMSGTGPTSGSGSGSWLALSTGRSWTLARTTVGTSSGSWRIEVASDAAGANIVASDTFTVSAVVDV